MPVAQVRLELAPQGDALLHGVLHEVRLALVVGRQLGGFVTTCRLENTPAVARQDGYEVCWNSVVFPL